MTPLVVLDSSVAIDVQRGGMLEAFFQLPAKFLVPDTLFEDELKAWFGEPLLAGGLIVEALGEVGIGLTREYMRRCPSLSYCDALALAQATLGKHTLLAGARDIRELGAELGLEVRGVLHVFDLIEEHQILPPASLHTCLTMVVRSRRTRLPQDEVQLRFDRYAAAAWPTKS